MKNLFLSVAITAAFLTTAAKAETINCTEITSVPVVISVQGVYCLKSDKSSPLASGNIIDIQANNVTIDLNGFKLGGLGAGPGTRANGISANGRQNITIRNGSVRGFLNGIDVNGSGYLVEDVLLDTNRQTGIVMQGSGNVVRNNRVVNTGSIGLFVTGRNTAIADNIISGTSATTTAAGIFLFIATLIELRNNTILDSKGGTNSFGIDISTGGDITVIANRILNSAGTGSAGIAASSASGINCIGNTVAGFTNALAGCTFLSDNITP